MNRNLLLNDLKIILQTKIYVEILRLIMILVKWFPIIISYFFYLIIWNNFVCIFLLNYVLFNNMAKIMTFIFMLLILILSRVNIWSSNYLTNILNFLQEYTKSNINILNKIFEIFYYWMSWNLKNFSLKSMLRVHMFESKVLLTKIFSNINKITIHFCYLILI